ncbi:MAG: glycosyltransferase family 4 protein [Saprospirales bacterium]|nr:glycosyltransferase family 4 protein [Saprospirales bacterium]
MPRILLTVTNDLSHDQRMQRICSALASNGYGVQLVGRALPGSIPLEKQPFEQRRLHCRFNKGFLFYAEYNLRLWWYLMQAPCDAVCSIDLDTLPAGCLATLLRRKKRVFDAHEYFTEVPEVTARPLVKALWALVARICLPFYQHAYTVGPALAAIFTKKYGIPFDVVRNVPEEPHPTPPPGGESGKQSTNAEASQFPTEPPKVGSSHFSSSPPLGGGRGGLLLLYQGALNEGRGIEQLLEALPHLCGVELWLAGEGDLSEMLRRRADQLHVRDKVRFLGYLKPADLKTLTRQAWLGINVLEDKGLSYYYSLANKYFDYIHAGVPVLTMDFPEYRALNQEHEVALLLNRLTPETAARAIGYLQAHPEVYQRLQSATREAREDWVWEKEKAVLLRCWQDAL